MGGSFKGAFPVPTMLARQRSFFSHRPETDAAACWPRDSRSDQWPGAQGECSELPERPLGQHLSECNEQTSPLDTSERASHWTCCGHKPRRSLPGGGSEPEVWAKLREMAQAWARPLGLPFGFGYPALLGLDRCLGATSTTSAQRGGGLSGGIPCGTEGGSLRPPVLSVLGPNFRF